MTARNRGTALAFAFTFLFGSGFVVGCATEQGQSDLDKALDDARKDAGSRQAAECYPQSKEPCYSLADGKQGPAGTASRGRCTEGLRACDGDGRWQTCEGAVLPVAEMCNKIDDDCNGKIDDGFERDGTKCFAGSGACRSEGTYSCSADGTQSVCSAKAKAPAAEVCDGVDNDCDGKIDDGAVEGTGDSCKTGQPGACSAGVRQCVTGSISCVPRHIRTLEICNKVDDDCDGKVDEDCITEEEAREAGIIK